MIGIPTGLIAGADPAHKPCPIVHVIAVEPLASKEIPAPTHDERGELSKLMLPVLTQANAENLEIERTYVAYPGTVQQQNMVTAYQSAVLDGYARLSQVASRIVLQCPSIKNT